MNERIRTVAPWVWIGLLLTLMVSASIWGATTHDLSYERDQIVTAAAVRWGVPPVLAVHVSHVEDWTGDSTAVSSSGAIGLMQIMPLWAHAFDADCGPAALTNRAKNACVGVHVMTYYFQQTNEWSSALRGYAGSAQKYRYTDALLDAYIQEAK